MPNLFDRSESDLKEIAKISMLLEHSKGVTTKNVSPEYQFDGEGRGYILQSYDQEVRVDYNTMAAAVYDAGYRIGPIKDDAVDWGTVRDAITLGLRDPDRSVLFSFDENGGWSIGIYPKIEEEII